MAPAGKIIWDTPTNALWRMEQRGLPWPAAHKLLLQWLAAGDVMLASRGRPVPPAHIAGAAFDHNDLRGAGRIFYPDTRVDWTTAQGLLDRHLGQPSPEQKDLLVKPEPEPEPKPERATQVVRATQRLFEVLQGKPTSLSAKRIRTLLQPLDVSDSTALRARREYIKRISSADASD